MQTSPLRPGESRRNSPAVRTLLAIETSTGVARVALVDAATGGVRAAAEAAAERHSSNLLRLCAEVSSRAGLAIAELDAIACGAGPGSFTGLRVAFAVAKGLAMPRDLPLVLVSSLEALAMDLTAVAPAGALLMPCLDAGKGQIYAAPYRARGDWVEAVPLPGAEVARELAVEPARLPEIFSQLLPGGGPLALAGPGARRYWDILAPALGSNARLLEVAGPSATSVAARALAKLAAGDIEDLGTVVPAYGRSPDITRPKNRAP